MAFLRRRSESAPMSPPPSLPPPAAIRVARGEGSVEMATAMRARLEAAAAGATPGRRDFFIFLGSSTSPGCWA